MEILHDRQAIQMTDLRKFYIDGAWVNPAQGRDFVVINPVTEEATGTISLGGTKDVDKAVAAAKRAFETYSETTPEERLALLRRIIEAYQAKAAELAEAISREMGAPMSLARKAQVPAGLAHLLEALTHTFFGRAGGGDVRQSAG
jgi:aldehyde dehydrogenase (NAD+)